MKKILFLITFLLYPLLANAANVGEPVVIELDAVEANASTVIVKKGFQPNDVWLELFDAKGRPVKVFWSLVPGTRDLIIFTATNGEPNPKCSVKEITIDYGGTPPGPEPDITPELKAKVGSLLAYVAATDIDSKDAEKISNFFRTADVVGGTTEEFRANYMEQGKKVFGGELKGKYAGLGSQIDKILIEELGTGIGPFSPVKIKNLFQAIAWAVEEGNK
jgi:hypothetical protein